MKHLVVALLLLAGCGPSAEEVLRLAKVRESATLSSWRVSMRTCNVSRRLVAKGLDDTQTHGACVEEPAKRAEYLQACRAVLSDATACELMAQREERENH